MAAAGGGAAVKGVVPGRPPAAEAGAGPAGSGGDAAPAAGTLIHPRWVRVTHWINAVAMVLMIGSGWQIYNASPLFPFLFPAEVTMESSM